MNDFHTAHSRAQNGSLRALATLALCAISFQNQTFAKIDASFDLPLPCEKQSGETTFGTNDQDKCTLGLRDCGVVADDVISVLNANYKFKLEQYKLGKDPILGEETTATPGSVPKPCDPLNSKVFQDDPSCQTAAKATITQSGGVFGGAGSNPPGTFENRFKWGLFVNSFTCAQNKISKQIKDEKKHNPSTSCRAPATDTRNLYLNHSNVADAATKTILPTLGEQTTTFCHQKDNDKTKLDKVASLCSKGSEMTGNGTFNSDVRNHLQTACQLEAARGATEAAFAHVAECTVLAEAYDVHEENVSKPASEFEKFLSSGLLAKCNKAASKAAKSCKFCSSSKRKKKAMSAYSSCYSNGIYGAFKSFAQQAYGSCGNKLQIDSASNGPTLSLSGAPGRDLASDEENEIIVVGGGNSGQAPGDGGAPGGSP